LLEKIDKLRLGRRINKGSERLRLGKKINKGWERGIIKVGKENK